MCICIYIYIYILYCVFDVFGVVIQILRSIIVYNITIMYGDTEIEPIETEIYKDVSRRIFEDCQQGCSQDPSLMIWSGLEIHPRTVAF